MRRKKERSRNTGAETQKTGAALSRENAQVKWIGKGKKSGSIIPEGNISSWRENPNKEKKVDH